MRALLMAAAMAAALAAPALAAPPCAEEQTPEAYWQGKFELLREDLRIRTRGGQLAFDLLLTTTEEQDRVNVTWTAGRAICIDPVEAPCDWVGARGQTAGRIVDGRLLVVLPVSADLDDPFALMLDLPRKCDGPARGVLTNARADFGFVLLATRPAPVATPPLYEQSAR